MAGAVAAGEIPGRNSGLRFPTGAGRFAATGKEWQAARMKRVYAMLQTVMDLYHQRPVLHSLVSRQTGRILRDFYTACQARDGKIAEQYLEELRGNQTLSSLNLLFLELQGMAASAKWDAILNHPRLEVLLRGRVPERIQRLLLRSSGHLMLNAIRDAHFPLDRREDARRLVLGLLPLYKHKPALLIRRVSCLTGNCGPWGPRCWGSTNGKRRRLY